jgi:hypothetical protein
MRVVFPTDEHRPYQDDRAVELAMQIASDFHPELRVCGSDGVDFFAISDFDADPSRKTYDSLQRELDAWKTGQRAWADATPGARKVYLPGNHEDRLRRYLWNHPEIAGLEALALPQLLDFAGLGIEYDNQPYEMSELVLFDQVVIRHGKRVRRLSGASATAELADERHAISVVMGHTHRGATVYTTTRSGVRLAQESFCLCQLNPGYVAHPDWQQGLVLIDVSADHLAIEAVPFADFRTRKVAYWRGKEYIA